MAMHWHWVHIFILVLLSRIKARLRVTCVIFLSLRFLEDEIRERWKLELSERVFEEMISQLEVQKFFVIVLTLDRYITRCFCIRFLSYLENMYVM